MHSIREFLTDDHRRCDDVFADVEQAVNAGDWAIAAERFSAFSSAVLQHFSVEEGVLFPAFEQRTGMTMGPTQVMRGEHIQMRQLISSAAAAIAAKDADTYAGDAETLLIMMQQHNMKEENILYPMCDQHLADDPDLLPHLQEELQAGA